MADFRSVQTRMWREDEWFDSLDTEARLFWIYLFTNPSSSPAGIFRLTMRTMSNESGIPFDRSCELMERFAADKKAYYNGGVVWIVNMRRLQFPDLDGSGAWQIAKRMQDDIAAIPNDNPLKAEYLRRNGYPIIVEEQAGGKTVKRVEIRYGYPIDTISVNKTETVTETVTKRKQEPERAAADLPDEAIDEFRNQYEGILGLMPTSIFPDAREYMAKLHARGIGDWWLMALRETVDHANRPGWQYMKSVLESWLAQGAPSAGTVNRTNGKRGGVSNAEIDAIAAEVLARGSI